MYVSNEKTLFIHYKIVMFCTRKKVYHFLLEFVCEYAHPCTDWERGNGLPFQEVHEGLQISGFEYSWRGTTSHSARASGPYQQAPLLKLHSFVSEGDCSSLSPADEDNLILKNLESVSLPTMDRIS